MERGRLNGVREGGRLWRDPRRIEQNKKRRVPRMRVLKKINGIRGEARVDGTAKKRGKIGALEIGENGKEEDE